MYNAMYLNKNIEFEWIGLALVFEYCFIGGEKVK